MCIESTQGQVNYPIISQRIYVALDEPDGVAGVAAVRTPVVSLEEQTLQYESTGMRVLEANGHIHINYCNRTRETVS